MLQSVAAESMHATHGEWPTADVIKAAANGFTRARQISQTGPCKTRDGVGGPAQAMQGALLHAEALAAIAKLTNSVRHHASALLFPAQLSPGTNHCYICWLFDSN